MKFSNTTYDTIVRLTKYILPGIGTLYFALAQIWGLPYGEQIVGSVVALEAFFGILLAVSKKNWDQTLDGTITKEIGPDGRPLVSINMENSLEKLRVQDTVTLKAEDWTLGESVTAEPVDPYEDDEAKG